MTRWNQLEWVGHQGNQLNMKQQNQSNIAHFNRTHLQIKMIDPIMKFLFQTLSDVNFLTRQNSNK